MATTWNTRSNADGTLAQLKVDQNSAGTQQEDYDDEDLDAQSEALSNLEANDDDDDENAVGTKNLQKEERKTLARRETQAVWCSRVIVYLVVLAVAIAVSLLVYMYTTNDQQQDFETQFAAFAAKLAESFYDSVERKIGSIASFSTTVTSYALASGSRFPNVTIPDMELRAAHLRIQADGVLFHWFPLVRDEDRDGWEAYANENKGWIRNAFRSEGRFKAAQDAKFGLGRFQQKQTTETEDGNNRQLQDQQQQQQNATIPPQLEQLQATSTYSYRIFEAGRTPRPIGSGPFLPLWQISPVLPIIKYLNYDMLNHSAVTDSLHAAIKSEQMVMGQAHDASAEYHDSTDSEELYDVFLKVGQYRHNVEDYIGDPITNIVYPVFANFDIKNKTLAGFINVSLYWRLNFLGILPETAKGIMCVISNSKGQMFTYRVDGNEVTFLGPGDLHDPKYDSMVVEEDVTAKLIARAGPENQAFDAADINEEHCRYYLHVYPSADTEAEYVTNEPLMYTALVASVFFFTSLVFILYDLLVARRQQIVMERAVQSSAIVSSLYPKQVRDRLFQEDNSQDTNKPADAWKANQEKTSRLDAITDFDDKKEKALGRPIADSYEACTVLFADLAGFTKFSSSRKPEDVFYLLETLYQAFDKIAVRRKVFKVETIGDCYVAVTGLPEPQVNHAVIMVKFARDCYSKMNQLLPLLAEALGPDAGALQFRVGLHSGPVTGGVLRGQKSRFQLFGDTINTASRMESNGIAGRIHMSQSTADELNDKGYARWVVPREDKIEAKGKGLMQTYFAILDYAKSAVSTDLSVLSSSISVMNLPTMDELSGILDAERRNDDSNVDDVDPLGRAPNRGDAPRDISFSGDVVLGEPDTKSSTSVEV